jgi:hypothetical protein
MITQGQREAWMGTRTGLIHPLMLRPGEIDERDLAQSLSCLGRFHGRGEEFCSIAQHCVDVSIRLRNNGADVLTRLTGLLHDAEEAYPPGDIISPVKPFMPSARRMLQRSRQSIFIYFLGFVPGPEIWQEVEAVDREMLIIEARRLFSNWRQWPNLKDKPVPADADAWRGPIPMKQAEGEFFEMLLGLLAMKEA